MKYKICPRCSLNYIKMDEELCFVCRDELAGKASIFDSEDNELVLCPYCERRYMGLDDIMCENCRKKREKRNNNE